MRRSSDETGCLTTAAQSKAAATAPDGVMLVAVAQLLKLRSRLQVALEILDSGSDGDGRGVGSASRTGVSGLA